MPPRLFLPLLLALASGSRLQQLDDSADALHRANGSDALPTRTFFNGLNAFAVARARRFAGHMALPGRGLPPTQILRTIPLPFGGPEFPIEHWPPLTNHLSHGASIHSYPYAPWDCSYGDLKSADFVAVNDEEVELQFMGRKHRLKRRQLAERMFQGVAWWDASLQGLKLEEEDESFIKRYTGTFAWSRNVGRLLRGLAPALPGEENNFGAWKEEGDRGKLAKEVLDFTIGMARALNKLPAPPVPKELYRGAWLSGRAVHDLLQLPTDMRLPWFQPTASWEMHSYKFMLDSFAPNEVDIGDISEERCYPVHFVFSTSRAKDVTHWNAPEWEHILLPDLPFDVTSAERVVNDPIAYMTSEELAVWLETRHTLPEWVSHGKGLAEALPTKAEAGPWPEAAGAVRAMSISGREFAKVYHRGMVAGVCELMGLSWTEQPGLHEALAARFLLGDKFPWQPHTFPFFIKVHLKDGTL